MCSSDLNHSLQSHTEAFESHTCIDNLCRKWFEAAVSFTVILHEHKVPYFNHLGMIVVDEITAGDFGTFFCRTEVDVDFRTRNG